MGACSSNNSKKLLFYEEKIMTEPYKTSIEELDKVHIKFSINS